jgi:hypothetical protein
MAYVYIHKRKDNNQPFYIGVGGLLSFDNYQRANALTVKGTSNRSNHWYNTVKLYGFTSEIILDNCTKEEAFLKEKKLIALYGRKDLQTGILINLTEGGEGRINSNSIINKKCGAKNIGKVQSIETKQKIANTKKLKKEHFLKTGEILIIPKLKKVKNYKAWNKGISHKPKSIEKMKIARKMQLPMSEETKLKISQSNKGKIFSEEHRLNIAKSKIGKSTTSKKVIDTITQKIYGSCLDAAKDLNINRQYLGQQLIGKRKNKTTLKYLNI